MGLFCDYYKGMCYKRIFQLHRQLRGGIDRQVVVLHRGKQQLLAARNLFLSLHLRLRTIHRHKRLGGFYFSEKIGDRGAISLSNRDQDLI